jgi:hypothetical protein
MEKVILSNQKKKKKRRSLKISSPNSFIQFYFLNKLIMNLEARRNKTFGNHMNPRIKPFKNTSRPRKGKKRMSF